MSMLEFSLPIAAPIQMVYDISQDYGVRYEWDPFPDSIQTLPDQTIYIRSKLGMEMWVRMVQNKRPYRAAMKMIRGPWFLEKFAGSWLFHPTGDSDSCIVTFRYLLITKPKLFRSVSGGIARLYFAWVIRKRLSGLKAYCEQQFQKRN
jgi:hypothetical protein